MRESIINILSTEIKLNKVLEETKELYKDFIDDLLYTPERVGVNSTIFKEYKIRTLKHGTDAGRGEDELLYGAKVDHSDQSRGVLFKLMRKFGIDELPQIINILKGEMNLFGYRPISEEAFNKLSDNSKEVRKKRKPGVFGGTHNYRLIEGGRNEFARETTWLKLQQRYKNSISFRLWTFQQNAISILSGENK